MGIHHGDVIAGITGTNIVRYDIYGPDVLIANKMESEGEAGRINVSEVARDIIDAARPGLY
jgi:class 3 adenylate cyclase